MIQCLPDRLLPGARSRLDAQWDGLGVNFAVFSAPASGVELCLPMPALGWQGRMHSATGWADAGDDVAAAVHDRITVVAHRLVLLESRIPSPSESA